MDYKRQNLRSKKRPFDTVDTGDNPRGEAWRFKELCKEFCEELDVGRYSTRRGVESCYQKLYNLKTVVKINYLKFKIWIAEAKFISL